MKKFTFGVLFGFVLVAGIACYIYYNYDLMKKTVVVKEVKKEVSAQDAIDAMMSKASEVNMKFVTNQPLHKELEARGLKSGHLEIFQFCNPEDARKIVDISKEFSAYMPCRISLVAEGDKLYLTMLNMDLMIRFSKLPPDMLKVAEKVREQLNAIMDAGASGDF